MHFKNLNSLFLFVLSFFLHTLHANLPNDPFAHIFKHTFQAKHRSIFFDAGPASPYFQDLGKQAQEKVGVPQEQQLPIKKFNPDFCNNPHILACAEPNAIYINEDTLNKTNPSICEFCLLHEAAHVLYDLHPNTPSLSSSKDHLLSKLLEQSIFNQFGEQHPTYHSERRADLTACNATKCSACLYAVAEIAHSDIVINYPSRYTYASVQRHLNLGKKGYLSQQAIKKLADEQKQLSNLCPRHTHEKLMFTQRIQKATNAALAALWLICPTTAWTLHYLQNHSEKNDA